MDQLEDISQATARVAVDVDKQTTSVHYTRLFNLGNYENEKIGITIEVLPGQAVQDVIEAAEVEVGKKHEEHEGILNKIQESRERLWDLNRKIGEAVEYKEQLEAAIKALEEANPEAVKKVQELDAEQEDGLDDPGEDWEDEEEEDDPVPF